MARGAQKVRVKTADLLAAIEKRRAKLTTDHERAVAGYDEKEAKYRAAVVAALRDRADKIEKGGGLPDTDYRGGVNVRITATKPTLPTLNAQKLDRMIQTLRMAADDAIAISADDYAEYLG